MEEAGAKPEMSLVPDQGVVSVATYTREDDLVIALQEATKAMTLSGRFDPVPGGPSGCYNTDAEAANRTTAIADIYVAWLRRIKSVKLTLVALEEQTGEVVATFTEEGVVPVSSMDTSQQLRYIIGSADDRGFAVDATLSVEVSDAAVVSATILEATAPEGTASGKDELLVVALAPGSSMVKVFDPAQPDAVFGSDSVDVVAGGVAAVVLSTPVVEEQPAPAPAPAPEPTP